MEQINRLRKNIRGRTHFAVCVGGVFVSGSWCNKIFLAVNRDVRVFVRVCAEPQYGKSLLGQCEIDPLLERKSKRNNVMCEMMSVKVHSPTVIGTVLLIQSSAQRFNYM